MRSAILVVSSMILSSVTLSSQLQGQAVPADEPPQVVANSCRPPVYPTLMRAGQVEGRVLLEFTVDTLGRVDGTTITTISSSHSQFEEAARRAVLTCRYRPAKANNQATRAVVRMPYTFSLRTERGRR